QLRDDSIVVEPPAACGSTIPLSSNINLVAAMTVGQNRWMFHTRTLGHLDGPRSAGGGRLLILRMPANVERCTRRSFFRISTADLRLPTVSCWPLLDPTSVVAAETVNRNQIRDLTKSGGVLDYELE